MTCGRSMQDSKRLGRSFQLTLGTTAGTVRAQCWTFSDQGNIRAANGSRMRWSPDGLDDQFTSFQTVTVGDDGRTTCYHGKLTGRDLLDVAGIESSGGRSQTTSGYAQELKECPGS